MWEGLILIPLQISSRCVRDFTSFPSDGPISLLPQRHTITGTNLFGVLKQTGGAGDDSTGKPERGAREKRTLSKHTRSTEGHQTAGRELWTDWDFYKNKYQERWMILNSSVCLYYTHKHSTRRSPSIECFCLDKNVLHLSPEFPVILDSGWFPRPKSSSPESTTRDRPITSHTCQEKHVTS